ncbi:2-polyprenyl-6-methoxyphenol hydroxylase [Streptomyces kasugaensis]|uniref:2-polyprenyl-6-methoxyphenol hydroxylase n=1 Tax=Streptomyces kasugaensis TaxID=1946 RepID=A0A4Q9HU34_STRKA|nr:FAD-dependent monooxygenase [Streptomyces kasugaensis]TBO57710.1 2-polyprenyl-6-methoxyphenol hydroxylase [Streptomyces kasugaensis]
MAGVRVVIVGGGIGGLAAAVALRAKGVQADVYEQAHRLGEVGAGFMLAPNSLRVLERLGLHDKVTRIGAPFTGFAVCQADGTEVSSLPVGGSDGYTMFGVHRADMVDLLVSSLPGDALHIGQRCVAFTQDDDHAVVTFENGASAEGDVVVGADGIHSVLQQHVVEPHDPVFSGLAAYRGVMPAERVPDWPDRAVRFWNDGTKNLLVYPVRRGELLNFVAFTAADEQMRESWLAPGDPQQLAAAFGGGWDPLAREVVSQVDATFRWGIYDRDTLRKWSQGRLALLGDAAHPMLPYMGQGANQAIEDAMGLATLLEGVSAADVPHALVRYQTLRRDRAARFQQGSRFNVELMAASKAPILGMPWMYDYDVEAEARTLR